MLSWTINNHPQEFILSLLGFRVRKNWTIVREEQQIGAQEILMLNIQSRRYGAVNVGEDYGEEMLRIKDRQDRETLLIKRRRISDRYI